MLLRVSLILAILLGIGTIVVTQKMARDHFTAMRNARNDFEDKMKKQTSRANTAEKNLSSTSNKLNQTQATLTKTEEELNGTKQQLATVQDALNKNKAELMKANNERRDALAQLEKWSQIGVTPEQVRDLLVTVQTGKEAIAAMEIEKQILSRRIIEL